MADFALVAEIPPLLGLCSGLVDMNLVLRAYLEVVGLGEIQVAASIARSAR